MNIETVRAQVAAWKEAAALDVDVNAEHLARELYSTIRREESTHIQRRREVQRQNNLIHGHNWGHHV